MAKSKKNTTVAVEEAQKATANRIATELEGIAYPAEQKQETKKEVAPATKVAPAPSKKDSLGFGVGTEASWLAIAIESGKYTKTELLAAFMAKFAPDANDTGNVKGKKTSFSVFMSDVKRPVGTYYSSRSLAFVTSDKGKLSWEPKGLDRAKEAIGAGVLTSLRNVPKGTRRAAILKEYNLPTE